MVFQNAILLLSFGILHSSLSHLEDTNAYIAFHIKNDKLNTKLKTIRNISSTLNLNGNELIVDSDHLQFRLANFYMEHDINEETRSKLVLDNSFRELSKYIPRRLPLTILNMAIDYSIVAEVQYDSWFKNVTEILYRKLNREGFVLDDIKNPPNSVVTLVKKSSITSMIFNEMKSLNELKIMSSAFVDTLFICRDRTTVDNEFCHVIHKMKITKV